MRRPISVIAGTKRVVSGSKEVAKCVAGRSREDVAWSIEAAFPVVGTELVRHCHFTGKAPQPSSGPLPEAADSSRVKDENQRKSVENPGTRVIAPESKMKAAEEQTKAAEEQVKTSRRESLMQKLQQLKLSEH